MRKMTGRISSGSTVKTREIDISKAAARQATAARSRLRLYAAARDSLRGSNTRSSPRGNT
jgi:hypothetical protein